jgi:hypothetical protein
MWTSKNRARYDRSKLRYPQHIHRLKSGNAGRSNSYLRRTNSKACPDLDGERSRAAHVKHHKFHFNRSLTNL